MRALRLVAVAGCAVVLVGCKPPQESRGAPLATPATTRLSPSALPAPSSTPAPTPTALPATTTLTPVASPPASPPPIPSSTPALELRALAALPIKGRAPLTGYSRAQFGPAWPTENGCDARNRVLARDLTKTTLHGSCTVETGTLVSPYTAGTVSFVRGPNSAFVQIDHVVALGDAWQTGAQSWTAAKREIFANDLLELLAVDEHSNEQKGDADAASWLPANKAFRCEYVSTQVDVKTKYGLWVTQAEHDAIAQVLAACGTSAAGGIQTTTAAPTTTAQPTPPKPAPTTTAPVVAPPKPTPTPSASGPKVVHAGSFCTPAGATGVTSAGTPMVCRTTATDSRLRWRAA